MVLLLWFLAWDIMDFKGIYGHPRQLVTDIVKQTHQAINGACSASDRCKFILMNTVGVCNPDPILKEERNWSDTILLSILRNIVPTHADNESAAAYLYDSVKQDDAHNRMDWCSVRPDGLVDADNVTKYTLHPSPTTTITNGLIVSRINVAHFMVELVEDDALWTKWAYHMPVILNSQDVHSK